MAQVLRETGHWCILRTAAGSTLNLARSLRDAGYDVWSPEDIQERRKPRSQAMGEVVLPLVPGLVFAAADRLDDLTALSHQPSLTYQKWDAEHRRFVTRGHPFFSVFRMNGRPPTVSDRELAGLRAFEASVQSAAARKLERERLKQPPRFAAGQLVRIAGAFEGLDLEVLEANAGKLVEVSFPGWPHSLHISAWNLNAVQLEAA